MRPARRIRNAGLDGAGALQELLSLEGERDAVRMAVEQLSSEFDFKRLDGCGDGRLRHVEASSCGRNLSGLCGGNEVTHLTESQSHKKFRYQRAFFRVLQSLVRRNKSSRFV